MQLRSGYIYVSEEEYNITEYEYYANLGRQFNTWKARVNKICQREINVGCDDLPDEDYYNAFVEGVTSEYMASHIIRDFYYSIME